MKIMVVDDDVHIQKLVSIHLSRKGYQVVKANDGEEALKILEGMNVDLAVVDVMMPGMDGFELTKILSEDYDIPVILLTAKGQLDDKERGFLSGSEDYIVKPFEVKELLYRVAVVLRRMERAMETVIKAGNMVLDRKNFEVMINQETILFPLKEFELLSILASRIPKIAPRALLIEQVWGIDYEGSEQTLNTHINRIRDRLRKHGATVEIQTVRGIGYKLEAIG
ncbi:MULTISPECIES: response regulator transcription factor [Bacillus]|uniref:response regulator transcription factor n=1 Tax=Bacillus TaxID=1386 RepID=UPI000B9A6FFF|nr:MULTISPECIES: response regulator transcription factor [Bacillus]OXT17865.1 DNA-binding response regulator [Bacillus sp. OG2]MCA1033113.1 response regulator transcription factor [Bacillus infantis]MCK6206495.1 response regulator transcription factor [Bacillus infantis]MCP1161072.1 response regulator transcription factor [Bacillus infantis]PLR73185.1 DNA-binding response regulator [Bacillus sp. UMB0728]